MAPFPDHCLVFTYLLLIDQSGMDFFQTVIFDVRQHAENSNYEELKEFIIELRLWRNIS